VPPSAPLLHPTAVTTSSVRLQWKQGDHGGSPIRGFILNFRTQGGEWEEITLSRKLSTFLVESLKCGRPYEFFLTGRYTCVGVFMTACGLQFYYRQSNMQDVENSVMHVILFCFEGFNKIGHGAPSETVAITLHGSVPEMPSSSAFIISNSTSFVMDLNGWKDSGCPITQIVVEYKTKADTHWKVGMDIWGNYCLILIFQCTF